MTVTAEATPLQTDVAVRKTVEAKDIELLSFSGRNPLGVPALKAGVIGGSFNNFGFPRFTTAVSTSTAAGPKRTPSISMGPSASARDPPERLSEPRTWMRSRRFRF